MRRVLRLGIHAEPRFAVAPAVHVLHQLHDFAECRHFEASIEGTVCRTQFRQPFAGTQGLDFGEREVLGKPAAHRFAVDHLGPAAPRKFWVLRNIGGAADLIFVPRDQHAVPGHDQIRFDVIGTLIDRESITLEGMFRPLAAGAAMRNHNQPG